MAITDADQLAEIAWRVVEADTTFTSGLWTVTEIANYFNQRQNHFNGNHSGDRHPHGYALRQPESPHHRRDVRE